MNKWKEITNKHQEEYNNFEGKFFAFSEEQFEKGMKKIGLNKNDINKIVSIGCGGYLLKSREKAYKNMFDKQHEEIDRLIKEDVTGEGFIKDMFYYALNPQLALFVTEPVKTLQAGQQSASPTFCSTIRFSGRVLSL